MIIKCPDDRMSTLVHPPTPASLRIGLGEHPLHVKDLDAGVHAPRGAQLAVHTERPAAAVTLVAGHVGGLVRGRLRLRDAPGHLGLKFEVQAGPEDLFRLVEAPVTWVNVNILIFRASLYEPKS